METNRKGYPWFEEMEEFMAVVVVVVVVGKWRNTRN